MIKSKYLNILSFYSNIASDSSSEDDPMMSPSSPNATDGENDAGEENQMAGSLSEKTPNPNNDTSDTQVLSEPRMNISFLCNPNNEDGILRQPSSVQNRLGSWSKDSTCELTSLT
jgi:hypothetical protein